METLMDQLKFYRYRRAAEVEAEPAPPVERQRHEWRVRNARVRTAAGDAGRLEVCANCWAERMVCIEEDGCTRVIVDGTDPEYCESR
jgi:hypothetical protein